MEEKLKNKRGGMGTIKRNKLIFYIICVSLPILQFCIFYIGVNLNSIALSFKKYVDVGGGNYDYTFAKFENYKNLFKMFAEQAYLQKSILNSLKVFLFTLLSIALAVCFAYYICKKHFLGKTFQVLLFIPHILSAVIVITMYKYFVENVIPEVAYLIFDKKIDPLLSSPNKDQTFGVMLFYYVWASFGTNTMLFCGSVNGISESIFDAAKVDGASEPREFISIVVPMIIPTITTLVIVGVASLFTQQMHLFTFWGTDFREKELYTIGYYLYNSTKKAGISGLSDYPAIATLGVCISLVTIPLTIIVRKCLNKIGNR